LLILISTFLSFEKGCLMINSYLEKKQLALALRFVGLFLVFVFVPILWVLKLFRVSLGF
jgi:hypothetical protein